MDCRLAEAGSRSGSSSFTLTFCNVTHIEESLNSIIRMIFINMLLHQQVSYDVKYDSTDLIYTLSMQKSTCWLASMLRVYGALWGGIRCRVEYAASLTTSESQLFHRYGVRWPRGLVGTCWCIESPGQASVSLSGYRQPRLSQCNWWAIHTLFLGHQFYSRSEDLGKAGKPPLSGFPLWAWWRECVEELMGELGHSILFQN